MTKNKINEIVTEPNPTYKSEIFKIKIRCTRYLKVNELKSITVKEIKKYTVREIRGG